MGWKKGSGIERKVNRGFVFSRFRVVNRMSSISRKKEKRKKRGMDFGDRGIRVWIQLRVKLSRIYLVIFYGWTLYREKISFSDNYSRNTVSAREKYIYIFPEEFYSKVLFSKIIIVREIDLEGGRSLGVLPINVKLIRMSCRSLNKINMAAVNV